MQMILSHNIILPKYLIIVKEKGSRMSKTRAWEGWASVFTALFSFFCISVPPSARSKKFRAKPKQAGGNAGAGLKVKIGIFIKKSSDFNQKATPIFRILAVREGFEPSIRKLTRITG